MRPKLALWSVCALLCLVPIVLCSSSSEPVSVVHVVFSNHFDAGFALPAEAPSTTPPPSYAADVVNRYFQEYIPLAIKTAQAMAAQNKTYVWTMEGGSWLLSLYLHCFNLPTWKRVQCPTSDQQNALWDALRKGYIAWHAFPFNAQPELYDANMFEQSLMLARLLEKETGARAATTMSQRDVPGMTRAVLPLLAANGVKCISIGCNGGSASIGAGPISVWRDTASNTDMLLLYHPGGYGGIDPADCVAAPGTGHILCYAWKEDNQGPHTVDEALAVYAQLEKQYPGAVISGGRFEDFVDVAAVPSVMAQLPQHVDLEMGDTWMNSLPTDPLMLAYARGFMRALTKCLADAVCNAQLDPDLMRYTTLYFTKTFEHTKGLDVKTFLHDRGNYTNALFQAALQSDNFQYSANSWVEQRAFELGAPFFFEYAAFNQYLTAELAAMAPAMPQTSGMLHFSPSQVRAKSFAIGPFDVMFDAQTGSVAQMTHRTSKKLVATSKQPFGTVFYQTFNSTDFTRFIAEYGYDQSSYWFPLDFGKPGLDSARPASATYTASLTDLYYDEGSQSVYLRLTLPPLLHSQYGAPSEFWATYVASQDGSSSYVNVTLQMFGKTATRLPEATWMSFSSALSPGLNAWRLHKMDSLIDPMQVFVNASQRIHATSDGVSMSTVKIEAIDTPVVSLGLLSPFPTPLNDPASLSDTFHWMIHSNVMGTNVPQWYPFVASDKDFKARFRISVTL